MVPSVPPAPVGPVVGVPVAAPAQVVREWGVAPVGAPAPEHRPAAVVAVVAVVVVAAPRAPSVALAA